MQYTSAGRTGIQVSRIAFGAGPVSGLMTGSDSDLQQQVVCRAVQQGINWFDTAAGYGEGRSEQNLGRILRQIDPQENLHVATKFRLQPEHSSDIHRHVVTGVEASLRRLGRNSLTLLQLHNGITQQPGDEPFSVNSETVLGPDGILAAFRTLQQQGMVRFLGLTGTGHPQAMRDVIRTGEFDMIQLPYNILNPSAGQLMPAGFAERNYGNILQDCHDMQLCVFAIRVFAAGAILGSAPSAHTMKTPFFPLELYERDRSAAENNPLLNQRRLAARNALQFALRHPAVHSAIIGFGATNHVDEAVADVCDPDLCTLGLPWPPGSSKLPDPTESPSDGGTAAD